MVRYSILICLSFLSWASAGERYLKVGGLLDPRTGKVSGPMTLQIEGQRIKAIGAQLAIPTGVPLDDLSQQIVMPGLMDCHTHLCWHIHGRKNNGYELSIVREPTAYRAIQGVMNARDMLWAGFTTVRDVGNAGNYADSSLRMAIEDGLVPGPNLINAGRLISPFGGQRYVIPERPDFTQPEYFFADTQDELKKAIRENIHFGALLIKLVVDDQKYIYSEEDIRFVVKEAGLAGLRVAAHCATDQGARNAILAGVASIEHGFSMSAETMDLAVAHKVPLVSTTFSLPALQSMAVDMSHTPEQDYASGVATLRLAYAHGVTVAFGSDVISRVPGMDRGQATLTYIQSFQDAGASNLQILQAFTIHAAAVIGIDQERGELKPGYYADLIALPGSPMTDINLLKQVGYVMKSGEVIRDH